MSVEGSAIFHAFDMHCSAVQAMLPQLHETGYTHIQLSPMQHSRTTPPRSAPQSAAPQWWFQYQPTEFKVGNCYGTSDDLRALTSAAKALGIRVLVDVCFNFMAELDCDPADKDEVKKALDTCYPPFFSTDFKPVRNSKGKLNWFQAQLPGLRTDTKRVQEIHFAYLEELAQCGVSGFRFDCAGWFPLGAAIKYNMAAEAQVDGQPDETLYDAPGLVYWELLERRDIGRIQGFVNDVGRCLEYMHADILTRAFSPTISGVASGKSGKGAGKTGGGVNTVQGLQTLYNFEQYLVFTGRQNVTFAVNHDTYNHEQSRISWVKFPSPREAVLATCFLLALQFGIPLVFRALNEDASVREAVQFRKHCKGARSNTTCVGANLLIVERVDKGTFLLNNSASDRAVWKGVSVEPKSVRFIFS